MKWFYQNEGREFGPLSETALQELHAGGAITDGTPVRREDSVGWQPCAIAFSQTPNAQQEPAHSSNQHLFKFECPHCQQHISTDEDCSGKNVQCPSCGDGFVVPSLNEGKRINISNHEIVNPKSIRKKRKTRILPKWMAVCICVITLLCIAWASHKFIYRTKDYLDRNDPIYSTYKKATRLDRKPFLGASRNVIYRSEINNEFLYCDWNSDKPFTGWVKQTNDEAPARILWSFKAGRMEKEFLWYDNGQLHQEVVYDINKADTVGGGDGDSITLIGRYTGIISVNKWTYDGEPCPGTNVVDGNGKSISYNYEGGETYEIYFYVDGNETKADTQYVKMANQGAYNLYMQGYNDPKQGETAELMASRAHGDDAKGYAIIALGGRDRKAGMPPRFELDKSSSE